MQKTNVFRGFEIAILIAAMTLTACGGGGGGGSSATSPSSTTTGSTSGGSGNGTASASYTLSWDSVTQAPTTVTGYRVYYGTAPLASQPPLGTIDTTVTSIDFTPANYKIAAGTTLYMAVSTLGVNGAESPVSTTVSIAVQ